MLAAKDRLVAAGLAAFDEMDTTCCYARQDKIWVRDPDGTPWEVFVTHEDTDEHGAGGLEAAEGAACGCVTAEAQERVLRMSDDGIQLNDPQTLYRRWEDSQWSPFAVDLETDREQWAGAERGRQGPRPLRPRVADGRRGADHDEVLRAGRRVRHRGGGDVPATQQVDEARHMQFYARFQDEVVAAPDVIAAHVERAREHVSDAFRHIFDEALVAGARAAGRQPRPTSPRRSASSRSTT